MGGDTERGGANVHPEKYRDVGIGSGADPVAVDPAAEDGEKGFGAFLRPADGD